MKREQLHKETDSEKQVRQFLHPLIDKVILRKQIEIGKNVTLRNPHDRIRISKSNSNETQNMFRVHDREIH